MKTFLSMFMLAIETTTSFGAGVPDQAPPVGTVQTVVAVNYTDDTIPQPMPKQYATRQVTTYQQQCQGGFCTLVPVTSTETYEVTNATSDPVGSKQKAAVVVASPAQAPPVADSPVAGRTYLFPRLHAVGDVLASRPKLFDGRFFGGFKGLRSNRGGCNCAGCGN